ncbi:MAG: sugar ABC transporter permease [Bifidobacteriaceae bacterium]|nr:sugar ABC transporter permease [Bifidobacteriaceae bacterium]
MATSSFPFPRRAPVRLTFGLALAVLVVFGLVPAGAVAVVSFTDLKGLPGLPVHWVGWENYIDYFGKGHRADNWNAFKNTIIFATLTVVIQITLALLVAVLLNGKLKGRNFYRSVVFMPTVLGVTVTALIWSLMMNPSGGPMQSLLGLFGADSAFFGDPKIALYLVIFVQVWMNMGVSVVIFISGLQAIPAELYEVATIDGASSGQSFRYVTFPMLAPSLTANVLLGIVNAMQSYQLTFVLTGAMNKATQVLSLQVYHLSFGTRGGAALTQSQGYAASISMIQFLLVGAISLGTMVWLRRRERIW